MGQTLEQIAEKLRDTDKKVQLIYAFNGTGKTRLSRAFKDLIDFRQEEGEEGKPKRRKILYYNALTEDLFYWVNDPTDDGSPRMKIQPNTFTDWVFKEQGQEFNVIRNFQRLTNDKLTPNFSTDFSEVTFSLERGTDEHPGNLKVSKGEESNFIWSVFYTQLQQVLGILDEPEPENRETNQFDDLEYVFIDDPVSSLDENHLIELAVNLGALIRSSPDKLKFIVTTHNPLFYNVLFNELSRKTCYFLQKLEDGTFTLEEKKGDSNKSFSYHLHLKATIDKAHSDDKIERFHFTLLRNLYEKTAGFLGYPRWSDLLPDDSKKAYYNRVIQFTSHSTLSSETVKELTPQEKQMVKLLLDHLTENYSYWQKEQENG